MKNFYDVCKEVSAMVFAWEDGYSCCTKEIMRRALFGNSKETMFIQDRINTTELSDEDCDRIEESATIVYDADYKDHTVIVLDF